MMMTRWHNRTTRKAPTLGAVSLTAVAFSATALAACEPPSWGLERIDTMATPPDPPWVCSDAPVVVAATHEAARDTCTFAKGATAEETLGITPARVAEIPVRHIIILMKENRSFDHILGRLNLEGQRDAEPVPAAFSNPGREGESVVHYAAESTCIEQSPGHPPVAAHCADLDL
jgi:hypothetical protein